MNYDPDFERKSFEAWAKSPPYERSCDRHGYMDSWPGQYQDYATQLAWEAWKAARILKSPNPKNPNSDVIDDCNRKSREVNMRAAHNPYYSSKCPCCGEQNGVVIRHWFGGGYDARCEKCGAQSPNERGKRALSSAAAVRKMVVKQTHEQS